MYRYYEEDKRASVEFCEPMEGEKVGVNKTYLGDCLEVMNGIADGCVDMVLCDLPYGTTNARWDSVIDLQALWKQYKRVVKKNGAIVLFAQTPFDKVLGASNLPMLRYEWIWEKTSATGGLNAKKMPMKAVSTLFGTTPFSRKQERIEERCYLNIWKN